MSNIIDIYKKRYVKEHKTDGVTDALVLYLKDYNNDYNRWQGIKRKERLKQTVVGLILGFLVFAAVILVTGFSTAARGTPSKPLSPDPGLLTPPSCFNTVTDLSKRLRALGFHDPVWSHPRNQAKVYQLFYFGGLDHTITFQMVPDDLEYSLKPLEWLYYTPCVDMNHGNMTLYFKQFYNKKV